MMDVLKEKIETAVEKWMKEIDDSPDGSYNIDITVEFEQIFGSNIIHISFGEDINENKFDF